MIGNTVQDLFRLSRDEWLETARTTARRLLRNRSTITIEDVLIECPRPKYLHPNTTGSVFNDRRFQSVGFVASRRSSSHGRAIRKWSLSDEYADTLTKEVV